jgi:hypothetical protein
LRRLCFWKARIGCHILPPAVLTVLFVQTTFYIQNIYTKLVLDLKLAVGPEVVMFYYHGGPNELWEYKNGMIYSKMNG